MAHQFRGSERESVAEKGITQSVAELIRQAASAPLLTGAVASMGLALGFQFSGNSRAARFVGLWAPALLMLDLYRRASAPMAAANSQRRHASALDLERRFEGGCSSPPPDRSSPPAEWEEAVDDGFRMTAARDPDDYSERISRVAPLKAK